MEQELETGKKDALTRRQLLRACVAAPLAFALAAASPSEVDAASKPGKAKVTSWSPRSRAVKVSWRRVARAKRYQVKVYTNSSLKKCVVTKTTVGTSLVIEGLKRASFYYVRVRGYRTSGGRRVYGKWSKKKLVHTKPSFNGYWDSVEDNDYSDYIRRYRKCIRKSVGKPLATGDIAPYVPESDIKKARKKYGSEEYIMHLWVLGSNGINVISYKNDYYGDSDSILYSYDVTKEGKIYDYFKKKWLVKK